MRRLFSSAALAAAFLVSSSAHAQSISSQDIERGLNPNGGASRWIPYDGAPYSHRYNYNLGAGIVYFNDAPGRIAYLDYLDKVDRAQKFGYPMPRPPYGAVVIQQGPPPVGAPGAPVVVQEEPEVIYVAPPPARGYIGFGFFRGR